MSLGRRLFRVLVHAPYLGAALIPALSPARALALGWMLECLRPEGSGSPGRMRLGFLLAHGPSWLVLHLMRGDAPFSHGLVLLAVAVASLPAWRRPGRWGGWVPVALLGPTLLVAVLGLTGRVPDTEVARLEPWRALGPAASAPAGSAVDAPALPPGAAFLELELRPPPALGPAPLADSPLRVRALTLVGLLLLLQAVAAAVSPAAGLRLRAGGLVLVAAAFLLARPPSGMELDHSGSGGSWRLTLVQGNGLWDPTDGALWPPAGRYALQAREDGRVEVRADGVWGVARERPAAAGTEAPEAAWLEIHPLRAPREGGPAASGGGLGLLRWWAAGETGAAGVRWALGEDGRLVRRPL